MRATAAVFGQIANELVHGREVRAVDQLSPLAALRDEPGTSQVLQVKCQGRWNEADMLRDLACGQPIRALLHQCSINGEPVFVRQRGKRRDHFSGFHVRTILRGLSKCQGGHRHAYRLGDLNIGGLGARQVRGAELPQERAQVVVEAFASHEAVAKPDEDREWQSNFAPRRRKAEELADVPPHVSRFGDELSFRAPVNDGALNLDRKRVPPQAIILLCPCVAVKCSCERDVLEHALRMQGLQSGAELMGVFSREVTSDDLHVLCECGFVHEATL